MGSRKNPIWRVVVADQRSPRDGRIIETVGRYNAQRSPSEIVLDEERLTHWLDRGAQPTGTVRKLMRIRGIGLAPGETPPSAPNDEARSASRRGSQPPAPAATAAEPPEPAAEPANGSETEASAEEPAATEEAATSEEPGTEEEQPAEAAGGGEES